MLLWDTSPPASHSADFVNKVSILVPATLKCIGLLYSGAFQVAQWVKNLPTTGDADSVHWWGRSPGGKHINPFQCSCLEDPMDRGTRRTPVHRVTNSHT